MSSNSQFVIINNVPLRVDFWGGVSPTDIIIHPEKKPKELILMIPGNPGVVGFYKDFLDRLYENTKKCIWILSHAGHDKEGHLLQENSALYNLEDNINQKKEFIEKYLKDVKLFFVGHSIGCKMILEVMKTADVKVEKCYLLFPTIERMAETKNALLDLIHPLVVQQALYLANDEMKNVRELDHGCIDKFRKVIKLYYGLSDGWVPVNYYENLVKCHRDVDAELCTRGFLHAFVLRDSIPMADILTEWMLIK